jgi:protein-glutamine gamma-glutamyltransferase
VSYQVTLEPNNRPWIFVLDAALDQPVAPGLGMSMTAQLQWVAERPVADLLRYRARSHTEFRHGPPRRTAALQDYLDLPPGFNPRTMAWASELRRDPRHAGDPARLVDAALQHLRSGGYSYTLEPGVYGDNTADEFWFDRKEGFCEHIASAFVVLMRSLDIPARIVTGYQGGELNGVDGFWVVRQSDAHAWAEVWLANRGWVRIDPTSAVAPGRIGSLQRLQAPRGVLATALGGVNPVVLFNLRAMWEALNNSWNQWVLNYNQTTQLNLLKDIGFESPSWEDLSYVLLGLVVLASLVGALWTLWERSRRDPWLRLLHRASKRARAAGVAVAPNSPPRRVAQLLQDQFGAADPRARAIGDWLLRLEQLRYARAGVAASIRLVTLRRELKSLPWPQ